MQADSSALQGEDDTSTLAVPPPAAPVKYLSCRFIERGLVFQPTRVIRF
jgi:hypothetical protein